MEKSTSDRKPNVTHAISDEHLGAVEGDRAGDAQEGNRNAPALDDEGMPRKNDVGISEDVLGANEDETQG
jgi:hypothetical protein